MKKLIICTLLVCSAFLMACSPDADSNVGLDVADSNANNVTVLKIQSNNPLLNGFTYETRDMSVMTQEDLLDYIDEMSSETLESIQVIQAILSDPNASAAQKKISQLHGEFIYSSRQKVLVAFAELEQKNAISVNDLESLFTLIQNAHKSTKAYYFILDRLAAAQAE